MNLLRSVLRYGVRTRPWRLQRSLHASLLALTLAGAAVGTVCPVAERTFIEQAIDAWPLAYDLGDAGAAQEIYATLSSETRAHYYVLNADAGQVLNPVLSVPARSRATHYRMLLVGPGFPRQPFPRWVRRMPGDNVLWAEPPSREAAVQTDALAQAQYRTIQILPVRAPVHARYVLIIYRERGEGGPYRVTLAGSCRYRLSVLTRLPQQWYQANYFVWPAQALARVGIIAAGIVGFLGLWYLGWLRRRSTASDGLTGF